MSYQSPDFNPGTFGRLSLKISQIVLIRMSLIKGGDFFGGFK